MDVVTINTYGGSLLLGVKNAGPGFNCNLSLEDTGFGVEVQRDNFPDLKIIDSLFDWPMDLDLRDKVVIAHPPCSGFSRANNSSSELVHGVTSQSFKQTINVLKYAAGRKAAAIIIESVCQTCRGGQVVHESSFLKEYYNIFRFFQNGAFLGTAQWRPRFWVVFLRKDINSKLRVEDFDGSIVRARDVVKFKGDQVPGHSKRFEEFKTVVNSKGLDIDFKDLAAGKYGTGSMPQMIDRKLGKKVKGLAAYVSAAPRLVNPNGLVTTVMGNSLWCMGGKLLTQEDYKICMGFPANYKMPPKDILTYLSKGVVPSTATWMLQTVVNTIHDQGNARWTLDSGKFFSVLVPRKVFIDIGMVDKDKDVVVGNMDDVLKKNYTGTLDTMRAVIFDMSRLAIPLKSKAAASEVHARNKAVQEIAARAQVLVDGRNIKSPAQEEDREDE